MNGLVRQYLPKGTDLAGYSQEQMDAIADEINNRPRKGLGVRSPQAVYTELLLNSPQHLTLNTHPLKLGCCISLLNPPSAKHTKYSRRKFISVMLTAPYADFLTTCMPKHDGALYLRSGQFACRRCQRVSYSNQTGVGHDHLCSLFHRHAAQIEEGKPKWQRWLTFDRLEARFEHARLQFVDLISGRLQSLGFS
jgi:hypothetical protein